MTSDVIEKNKKIFKINLHSKENLVKNSGVFQSCFRSVRIEDFGIRFYEKVEYDEDLLKELQDNDKWDEIEKMDIKVLENFVTITLDLRYYLKEGGSNGVSLMTTTYNFNSGKWDF